MESSGAKCSFLHLYGYLCLCIFASPDFTKELPPLLYSLLETPTHPPSSIPRTTELPFSPASFIATLYEAPSAGNSTLSSFPEYNSQLLPTALHIYICNAYACIYPQPESGWKGENLFLITFRGLGRGAGRPELGRYGFRFGQPNPGFKISGYGGLVWKLWFGLFVIVLLCWCTVYNYRVWFYKNHKVHLWYNCTPLSSLKFRAYRNPPYFFFTDILYEIDSTIQACSVLSSVWCRGGWGYSRDMLIYFQVR